jgi:hypothetical protein
MYLPITALASVSLYQDLSLTSACLRVPKNHSQTALSEQSPLPLMPSLNDVSIV